MKTNRVEKIEYLGMGKKEDFSVFYEQKEVLLSIPFGSYSKKTLSEAVIKELEMGVDNDIYYLSENCVMVGLPIAIALLKMKTIAKKIKKNGGNFENIFKVELSTEEVDPNNKESLKDLLEKASQEKAIDDCEEEELEEELEEEVDIYIDDPENEIKIKEVYYHGFSAVENFQDCGEEGDIVVTLDSGEYSEESLKKEIQKEMMNTEYAPNWSEWEKFYEWNIDFILSNLRHGEKENGYSHVFVVWLNDWYGMNLM